MLRLLMVLLIWVAFGSACTTRQSSEPPERAVEPVASPAGQEPIVAEADIPEPLHRETEDEINRITPHFVDGSSEEIYVPNDLDESFRELDRMLHPKFIAKLKAGDDEATNQHFGLGLWIRNNWRLWAGSRLSEFFHSIGIFHPDDMSGVILASYVRHLKGQPIRLEEQVKYYRDTGLSRSQPRIGRGGRNEVRQRNRQ